MATTFLYDQTDFPNGLDLGRFAQEISSIGPTLRGVRERPTPAGFDVRVRFAADLSAPDEAALSAVVAAHNPAAPRPPGHLLADLVARQPTTAGRVTFARDGRKAGEASGAGTGVLVYSDGAQWLGSSTDLPPTT